MHPTKLALKIFMLIQISMSKRFFYILCVVVLECASGTVALSQGAPSKWDSELLERKVGDLSIEENSLPNAWTAISYGTLAHSVLFVRLDASSEGSFKQSYKDGTFREWLDALVTAYPKYMWEQDEPTKIVWIHPKDLQLSEIFANKVNVSRDEAGLRMEDDVLEPIAAQPAAGISVDNLGTLYLNTFDYAMSVHRGATTTRQIVSECCAWRPSIGFYLRQFDNATPVLVQPVFLPFHEHKAATADAARSWWKAQVNPSSKTSPSMTELQDALANSDPNIREAARQYLNLNTWNVMMDELLHDVPQDAKGLWTAIGVFAVMVRTEAATETDAIKTIRRIINSKGGRAARKSDPALFLLASLEMYRVAGDETMLNMVKHSDATASDLSSVHDDILRVIHACNKAQRLYLFKMLPYLSSTIDPSPLFQVETSSR